MIANENVIETMEEIKIDQETMIKEEIKIEVEKEDVVVHLVIAHQVEAKVQAVALTEEKRNEDQEAKVQIVKNDIEVEKREEGQRVKVYLSQDLGVEKRKAKVLKPGTGHDIIAILFC